MVVSYAFDELHLVQQLHSNLANRSWLIALARLGISVQAFQHSSHCLFTKGATITWTVRCCSQDRCNEASQPAAEESGCGLAASCAAWLWLGHCISHALANARIYIAAPVSAMPALTQYSPYPWPGFDQSTSGTIPNAAIINSLGAAQLRLVAPSALALSLFDSRLQPAACLLAYCPA